MCLLNMIVIWAIGYLVWQIVDLILFSTNFYSDGNGVPLLGW